MYPTLVYPISLGLVVLLTPISTHAHPYHAATHAQWTCLYSSPQTPPNLLPTALAPGYVMPSSLRLLLHPCSPHALPCYQHAPALHHHAKLFYKNSHKRMEKRGGFFLDEGWLLEGVKRERKRGWLLRVRRKREPAEKREKEKEGKKKRKKKIVFFFSYFCLPYFGIKIGK